MMLFIRPATGTDVGKIRDRRESAQEHEHGNKNRTSEHRLTDRLALGATSNAADIGKA